MISSFWIRGRANRLFSNRALSRFCFFIALLTGLNIHAEASEHRRIHLHSIVADAHNDVLQRMLAGEDIGRRTTRGHSDLPRFREGGVDIQLFSVWVNPDHGTRDFFRRANHQIDVLLDFVERNRDSVGLALNASDIDRLLAENKFIAMMALEGGHPIENDLSKLDHLYARGIRSMAPVWNNSLDWVTSAYDEDIRPEKLKHVGLTEFGREVIRHMNRIGMIIDVSHASETTFWHIIQETKHPVIASHSSVWELCRHRRNLKDPQLRAIAKTGGVVFINFHPPFIDSTFSTKERRLRAQHQTRIDSLRAVWKTDQFSLQYAIADMLQEEYRQIRPPLSVLIDHIDYAVRLIGIDHVGLGSDFDGIHTTPLQMDDVSRLPNITRELLNRGYAEADIKKILGENFLRVVREVCQ